MTETISSMTYKGKTSVSKKINNYETGMNVIKYKIRSLENSYRKPKEVLDYKFHMSKRTYEEFLDFGPLGLLSIKELDNLNEIKSSINIDNFIEHRQIKFISLKGKFNITLSIYHAYKILVDVKNRRN